MSEKLNQMNEKLSALISESMESKNYDLANKLLDVSKILTEMRLAKSQTETRKVIRNIAKRNIEMWKLPNEISEFSGEEVRKESLSIVDTRTGKISRYVKDDEYIHENMTPEALKDNNYVSTDEYFGGNGFKRMRLLEDSLTEVKTED